MTSGRVQGASISWVHRRILMLDTHSRGFRDMGNASTFPFPVRYQRVEGASPDLVGARRGGPCRFRGGRGGSSRGVGAITTNCGFLVKFQRELAASVRVPVFTSSLLLCRWFTGCSGRAPGRIMTVNSAGLTSEHFAGPDRRHSRRGGRHGEREEFTRVMLGTRCAESTWRARARAGRRRLVEEPGRRRDRAGVHQYAA